MEYSILQGKQGGNLITNLRPCYYIKVVVRERFSGETEDI